MATRRDRLQARLERGRAALFQRLAGVCGALLTGKASVAGRRMARLISEAERYAELVAAVLERPPPRRPR